MNSIRIRHLLLILIAYMMIAMRKLHGRMRMRDGSSREKRAPLMMKLRALAMRA
jgi:hypothetical protein